MVTDKAKYTRILLKLSGEALSGTADFGIDPKILDRMALEVKEVVDLGVQVGMVIGGGNLFRGASLHEAGMERVTGDHMGMLATVMNALAMRDALERANIATRAMSSIQMTGIVEQYDRRSALRYLNAGDVVIFSAGTGNPFFTTDSAACLRGIEIDADLILKATKVDGVYSSDPSVDSSAVKFDKLSYDEVIEKRLGVMDLTAICLSRDHHIPIKVFSMQRPGALLDNIVGKKDGTLID
ncbi:UMP kinase [Gammaproteobacteria bacterium]|nr:UMP kinase [Gammaproteobacteria bacterium]